MDLDLLRKSSPFPRAVELCLKGMVYNIRDALFWVSKDSRTARMDEALGNDDETLHFQVNPKNWPFVRDVREACRLLRKTGAQWIHERKTAMRNGDVPKDILTQIIKSAGKGYCA